ncbi:hypothetical protein L484_012749 [Morus notabilis]|uniref:Uncharacterized protein n=1 Tax=Morus notabilis TaxID=981085 RepID=W9RFY5_9ROSA|nr:hypothetical protein L484_012749 [Morus notabilis]
MCGKQLKHYPAFCRNGITIAVQSFVFVMANGENDYIAYLEDMYEDKRECVDGLATILTREHYEKCLAAIPHGFLAKDEDGYDNLEPCNQIMSMNQEMKVVGSELESEPLLPVDEFRAYVRPYLVVAEGLHPRHMHVFSCGRSL